MIAVGSKVKIGPQVDAEPYTNKMPEGSFGTVVSIDGEWYSVRTADGHTESFVIAELIALDDPESDC